MILIILRLLAVAATEAALIVGDYGSGYGSEIVVFAVIPVGAIAASWWILSRHLKFRPWSASALSVFIAFLGLWAGMVIALNTWGE